MVESSGWGHYDEEFDLYVISWASGFGTHRMSIWRLLRLSTLPSLLLTALTSNVPMTSSIRTATSVSTDRTFGIEHARMHDDLDDGV